MKKIITLLTLLLCVSLAIGAYAWWDFTTKDDSTDISVGDYVTLTLSDGVLSPADKNLVPEGALLGPDDVTELTVTYTLSIDKELATSATINVEIDNPDEDLFVITYNLSDTTVNQGDTITLTVTVSLIDDAELNDYSSIQNTVQEMSVTVFLT